MVVGNHLFSFYGKKFGEGVTRYESHPPSLRTVYFPTAPFCIWQGREKPQAKIPAVSISSSYSLHFIFCWHRNKFQF